eukprot:1247887-Alexandrium_andersonii.AAC.1
MVRAVRSALGISGFEQIECPNTRGPLLDTRTSEECDCGAWLEHRCGQGLLKSVNHPMSKEEACFAKSFGRATANTMSQR